MTSKRYLQTLSKEELSRISKLGVEGQRTPELKHANEDREEIRLLYDAGVNTKEIAERYKINRRQVYRILDEK